MKMFGFIIFYLEHIFVIIYEVEFVPENLRFEAELWDVWIYCFLTDAAYCGRSLNYFLEDDLIDYTCQ